MNRQLARLLDLLELGLYSFVNFSYIFEMFLAHDQISSKLLVYIRNLAIFGQDEVDFLAGLVQLAVQPNSLGSFKLKLFVQAPNFLSLRR